MLKKLFSHSVIYALGPQIPKLGSLFLLPFITANLTTVDYGIWGLVGTYTALLGGIRDLGMAQPMVNVFFKYPSRWKIIWSSFYGFLILWSIPFSIFQSLLLWASLHNLVGENIWTIIIIYSISLLILDIPTRFCTYYFQLSAKPLPVAIISAISGIITMVFQFMFVVYYKWGYMSFLYSSFVGNIISFCFYLFFLTFKIKMLPNFKLRYTLMNYHLRIALPTIPHNYSSYLLNTSDRLVMNFLGIPANQIGLYSFAYNFGNYAELVGGAIGMAVSPFSLRGYSFNKEYLTKYLFWLLQSLFLVGTLILCIWLKEIFEILVHNSELVESYSLAIIIVLGYMYRPMYWCIVNLLGFKEKTSALWKITLVGGILNIIGNLVFIPIYGFEAACYTTFFALLYIGFAGFYLQAFKQVSTEKYYPNYWLLAILVSSVLTYLLKDSHVILKLLFSASLFIALFVLWQKNKKIILQFKELL